MIAHRLQTIQTAENLLFLESPTSVIAGEKGTSEYTELIDRLVKTNYAHQVSGDGDDDAAEIHYLLQHRHHLVKNISSYQETST